MTSAAQQLLEKLDHIQSDIKYIKEHLVDIDLILTDEDLESLQKAEEDLKAGRTKRLA